MTTSHAWGKDADKLLKLTEGNLEDWKRQLPEKSLPQGFIDAIYVTRKLGVRYLWIDALCILQGCKQDWEIESGRMASYYKKMRSSTSLRLVMQTGNADFWKMIIVIWITFSLVGFMPTPKENGRVPA